VAIKVLPAHLMVDDKLRSRFRRESQAAARLHHTNIVPVFVVGEQNGLCFYVMQMIEGVSIDQVLRPNPKENSSSAPDSLSASTGPWYPGVPSSQVITNTPSTTPLASMSGRLPFSPRAVARIGVQVAEALAYAHHQGVLHRDIKPSNLLLDGRGTVWVTDFGVAKMVEEANLTQSGDLVGTLRYLPPERFQGQSDARGDVYSLGITLYEMLLRRPAFRDTTPHHLIQLITQADLPPLRTIDPAIPADLETIVAKATARDPAHRYQSATELAEDLRRFLDDRPVLARRISAVAQLWRWCRRNQKVAILTAAAGGLLLVTTVVSATAYFSISAAMTAQQTQRERAESIAAEALEAMNQIYESFAPNRLIVTPGLAAEGPNGESIELPTQPILAPEAVTLLEKLLGFYEQLAREGSDIPKLHARAAEANQRIGDIRQRLGEFEPAIEAYRKAIALYTQPTPDAPNGTNPIKLARTYNELGRSLRMQQQGDEAREAHAQALTTLTRLAPEVARRPEVRYEMARTYYFRSQRQRVGLLLGPPPGERPPGPEGGRGPGHGSGPGPGHGPGPRNGGPRPPGHDEPPPSLSADGDSCQRAIVLLKELVRDHPTVPEYRHLLACCYRDAQPTRSPGDPPGPPRPGDNVDQALKILRQLVKDYPKVPDYSYELSETISRIASPRRPGSAERSGSGGKLLEEAKSLITTLVNDYPSVLHYTASSAQIHDRLGNVYLRNKEFDKAETTLKEAVRLQTGLVKQHPQVVNYNISLSLIESALARTLKERNKSQEARDLFGCAIKRIETFLPQDPNPEMGRDFLQRTYLDLESVLKQQGETELAANARRKAESFGPERGPGHFGPPGGPGKH
jgi:tetratricopeptide (TPR) repeat protein